LVKEPLELDRHFPEIAQIDDPALREAVAETWRRLWEMSAYEHLEDVPVSLKVDYSGLKHAQAILQGAMALAPVWERVHGVTFNRDHLIAGALLMDVSKLVEYRPRPGRGHEATELGSALPHATYAAHLALELGVPLAVVHIVMAHSPNGGKAPATPEAHLLDAIDQADIHAFGVEIWTRKVMHYQP
jgi:hypothetical protein